MTKKFTYTPTGVCCRKIEVELEGDTIKDVTFTGGCNGNLNGIKQLILGQSANDIIAKLQGVECGARGTSCPDQLTKALKANI